MNSIFNLNPMLFLPFMLISILVVVFIIEMMVIDGSHKDRKDNKKDE
jgi:hypothetical protein